MGPGLFFYFLQFSSPDCLFLSLNMATWRVEMEGGKPSLSTGLNCFYAAFTILMLSACEKVWFSPKKDHSEILIFKILNETRGEWSSATAVKIARLPCSF